jgi:hypothetical protein
METIETKNKDQGAFAIMDHDYIQEGLSKREYFAAKAMQSYAAGEYIGESGMRHEKIASWSVQMADALLSALENKL